MFCLELNEVIVPLINLAMLPMATNRFAEAEPLMRCAVESHLRSLAVQARLYAMARILDLQFGEKRDRGDQFSELISKTIGIS